MLPGSSDLCSEVALGSGQTSAAPRVPGCLRPMCQGPGKRAPCPRQTVPAQKYLRPQRVHQTEPTRSGSVFKLWLFLMLKLNDYTCLLWSFYRAQVSEVFNVCLDSSRPQKISKKYLYLF